MAVAVIVARGPPVYAQGAAPGTAPPAPALPTPMPANEFLDRSFIFYGAPWSGPAGHRVPLVFEASISPHFYLYDSLASRTPFGASGFAWSLVMTLQTRLRMTASESSPIRMPSYMPRLEVQFFRIWAPSAAEMEARARAERSPTFALLGVTVGINHHSNGQSGCAYDPTDAVADGTPACERLIPPPSTADLADLLNRTNGNFATNYVSVDLGYRRGQVGPANQILRSWTAALRGELHIPTPGGLLPSEADLYGRWRVRALGEYLREFGWGRLRFEGAFELVPDAAAAVVPYRLWAEVDLSFPRAGGVGLFARWYSGQDYYNAFFVDRLDQAQFGLLFDLSPMLPFAPRPTGR